MNGGNTSDQCHTLVSAGVGPVTSADVNLAAAAGAQVLGFGVPPTAPDVESLARGKGIKVRVWAPCAALYAGVCDDCVINILFES